MADVDFDNPAFDLNDVDDDEAPLLDPTDEVIDPTDVGVGVGEERPLEAEGRLSLRMELLKAAVDNFYDSLAADQGLTPDLGRFPTNFELVGGRLYLKAYPKIELINSKTQRPLSLKTIASRAGGMVAIREGLGFSDWTSSKKGLPAKAVKALGQTDRELGEAAAAAAGDELKDLGQTATKASDAVQVLETALTDEQIDKALGTIDDPPFNLRELRGLDRALQTIRGELTNNLAKLTWLDEEIARQKTKLDEADSGGVDEFTRRRLAERVRDLQDERASRLEAASANREALRSQISRIRETIHRVLSEDTTLAERIRTLFREQGITIASILTAIGMTISTLVLALTGSAPSPPPPPPPPGKGGLKEWLKKHLRNLGRILAKLAGKAAAALPGIIGSIVSWLLSTLGKAVSWFAENLWAVVVAIGALLLMAAREWLLPKK